MHSSTEYLKKKAFVMYFEIDNCKTEVEKETLPIRNSYFHTGRKIGNAIPHDFWLCGISGL